MWVKVAVSVQSGSGVWAGQAQALGEQMCGMWTGLQIGWSQAQEGDIGLNTYTDLQYQPEDRDLSRWMQLHIHENVKGAEALRKIIEAEVGLQSDLTPGPK